jgi:hypothetical protein
MKHLTALVLATLALGSPVMARENNYQSETKPGRDVTQADAFWQSEHGADMKRLIDLMQAGDEEGFQKAHEVYRQKYNAPPLGGWQEPQQPRPSRPMPDLGPPMMLPPEAR